MLSLAHVRCSLGLPSETAAAKREVSAGSLNRLSLTHLSKRKRKDGRVESQLHCRIVFLQLPPSL